MLPKKTPYTRSVRICTDSMLEQTLLELEDRAADLRQRLTKERAPDLVAATSMRLAEIDAEIDTQKQAVADASIEFVFRALPAKVYERLVRQHRPTDEQKAAATELATDEGLPKAAAQKLVYNPDTFPPAIIAATLISPKMTVDEVIHEIWGHPEDTDDDGADREETPADAWNTTERGVLFQTARNVCQGLSLPR